LNGSGELNLKRQFLESDKIWKVLEVNERVELKEKDIIKLGES
jgi:hypothetical protein